MTTVEREAIHRIEHGDGSSPSAPERIANLARYCLNSSDHNGYKHLAILRIIELATNGRTLAIVLALLLTPHLYGFGHVCMDTRRGWTYQSEPCVTEELIQYGFNCENVRSLPHCNPPATLSYRIAPSPFNAPHRFGGVFVVTGYTYWRWLDASGRVAFVTPPFYVPESEAPSFARAQSFAMSATPATPRAVYRLVDVHALDRAGMRYTEPYYLFVAVKIPNAPHQQIVVFWTPALNQSVSYGIDLFVIKGNGANIADTAVLPIRADLRDHVTGKRRDDQFFEIRMGMDPRGPAFAGPTWVSELAAARADGCVALGLACP